jgi:uncharacterized membrane protein YdjX (TVP38/TMEM64 family)
MSFWCSLAVRGLYGAFWPEGKIWAWCLRLVGPWIIFAVYKKAGRKAREEREGREEEKRWRRFRGGRQRKNEALFFLIFFALFVSLASSFWH